jgi:TPP-dependent pyruvate/acetoin dehydrogenase alpha subunit
LNFQHSQSLPQSADLKRIYSSLRLIRRAEEEVARIYPSDKIKSPVHLSIGQEAAAVGICDALQADDAVSGTYRGHAAYMAKGGDLNRLFAELYGKATGITGGIGGSMHLIDIEHGVLGTSAVVGTTVPIAAGFALAFKREGKKRVVAAYFGDGATEEGVFTETLNFAALHKLPMLFVCENNGYAIHTPSSRRWASDQLIERVATYGIPTVRIEDQNVFQIRAAALDFIAAMREGAGPAFIECKVYRWREHVGPNPDFDQGYRSESEMKPWMENDQVAAVGKLLPDSERKKIDDEVEACVAAAIDFAERSPFPGPERLYDNIYA